MCWKSFITKINLYRVKALVICKPGLYRAWDIVGKAGLRCHAFDFISDNAGVTV